MTTGSTARKSAGRSRSPVGDAKVTAAGSGDSAYQRVYRMNPDVFIREVKSGAPAKKLGLVARDLGVAETRYADIIGVPRSTYARRLKDDAPLTKDETERHLRVMRMIGLVSNLVNEFGDPEGFHAAQWFGAWIEQPNPALGDTRPSEYLDTAMGAEIVEATILRMFTGAYA